MSLSRWTLPALVLLLGAGPSTRAGKPPAVPGYDRFPAAGPEAGRILLGELNCTACHKPEGNVAAGLHPKKAPILSEAGDRLQADWLRAWLANPNAVKPGTTMPHVLEGRNDAVEPLVHYVLSLRSDKPAPILGGGSGKAKDLFGTVGCLACHAPPGQDGMKNDTVVVPLGDLKAKYAGAPALAQFLLDPLKSRPSGRMPRMNLTPAEAVAVATHLVGAGGARDPEAPAQTRPGVSYEYFEGSWSKLPDFDALPPVATGTLETFSLKPLKKDENVGLRFHGYLEIPADGVYTFTLSSDDGSRLSIGNLAIVNHDGVHGATELTGSIHLRKGKHAIRVEWFEASGGEELHVHYEGPGLGKRPIPAAALSHDASGKYVYRETSPAARFQPDPAKAAQGRKLFGELRCASCHQVPTPEKSPEARPLAAITKAACPTAKFDLSAAQARAIEAALAQPAAAPTPAERIHRTMATFACYSCHERGGRGGVEPGRNEFFVSTEQTVGDEGRIPPRLNDAGAKLRRTWLQQILNDGTKVRPYTLTRMPAFGLANIGHLVDDFERADAPKAAAAAPADKELVKHGRTLVGTKGLSCVSCHMFNGHKAQGIQAMDLVHMPARLNRDWYDRYMVDPAALRPGTRMPTFWPEGKAVKKDLLGGETAPQLEAIWQYLSEGTKARNPVGIGPEPILLVAKDEAVMYRNFIQGAGPRAIAVGYPERMNLAFDAQKMRMALLWKGDFIDASKHWIDRGAGFQQPAGENIVPLADAAAFGLLADPAAAWPKTAGKEAGHEFEGYQLDRLRRPTFHYSIQGLSVKDFPEATATGFKRTFTFEGKAPENLWYRAAGGTPVEKRADGSLKAGPLTIRIEGAEPVIRKDEILVPVKAGTIVQHYQW